MRMVRQLGFDHSHIEVWGAKDCLTRTAIPLEWALARVAFFRAIA